MHLSQTQNCEYTKWLVIRHKKKCYPFIFKNNQVGSGYCAYTKGSFLNYTQAFLAEWCSHFFHNTVAQLSSLKDQQQLPNP